MFRSVSLFLKAIFLSIAFGLLCASYIIYYYSRDLPDYNQLSNYHPPALTRVYSADGKLIEEYAKERRIFVPINAIPRSLIEAFIAAEDKNFYDHPGVDVLGIVRAATSNVMNILQGKRMEGASTITQQVVKNFLLTSEQSISRKVKEAILSYMVSRVFTKDQILELYLNQIYLGKHSYGVATAAQSYFNKSVEELTLEESAFLAGLPKAPSAFNPERNYKRAKQRRDYVLIRMYEDGYISKEALREALEIPITLKKRDQSDITAAPYYAEQVRNEVIQMFGSDLLYSGGLTIITSLNTNYQKYAEQALRNGLQNFDKKRGFRAPLTNIQLEKWAENLKLIQEPEGLLDFKLAVVLEIKDDKAKIGLKDGTTAYIPLEEMKWARYSMTSAKTILKVGDVVVVEEIKAGRTYGLRQIPEINGAIIAMEPKTGKVLAMVGGYDFRNSQFNRATQALRQPGSTAKPFVYEAALESGMSPTTIFNDGPIELSQGPGMPTWRPKNYKGDFLGLITMREGLEKSRNLVTIRVAQQIGINKVAEVVKRFGINNNPPRYYSMVLGAVETTLDKLTNAYSILANGGKEVTPHYIELIKDRNGKVIYKRDLRDCESCVNFLEGDMPPDPKDLSHKMITDPATAYQMCSLLNGVVQRGTGQAAKKLSPNLGGKTGTTNDSKDAFFIGISPDLVVGTFVGYDTPRTMGKFATGATISLPIFINFMGEVLKTRELSPFPVPEGISLVKIDPKTGVPSDNPSAIIEAFKTGTEPSPVYRAPANLRGSESDTPPSDTSQGEIY
jgi:penicillin-binding protein 1A